MLPWSISPATGTISQTGLYSAPMLLSSSDSVTVKANSVSNPTLSATAIITLNAPKLSLQSLGGGQMRINWTAPAGRSVKDYIAITSLSAPTWWMLWSGDTFGRTSGSFDVTLPSTPGLYEFRYFSSGTYQVLFKTPPVPVNILGYTVIPTLVLPSPAGSVKFAYSAANPMPDDCIALVPVGKPSEAMVWFVPTGGAKSGSGESPRSAKPGKYELRYLTQGGYVSVVISAPIDIL